MLGSPLIYFCEISRTRWVCKLITLYISELNPNNADFVRGLDLPWVHEFVNGFYCPSVFGYLCIWLIPDSRQLEFWLSSFGMKPKFNILSLFLDKLADRLSRLYALIINLVFPTKYSVTKSYLDHSSYKNFRTENTIIDIF